MRQTGCRLFGSPVAQAAGYRGTGCVNCARPGLWGGRRVTGAFTRKWYSCRWGIEVWHRILKSGCRIEARQLASGERLQRCLTLYSVIAWRIFSATMLARAVPDMPCSVLLDLDEWQALYCAIHQCPTPPEEPPSLVQAVHWIAQLGGFVGRRRRDQPGTETLWRGFQHLMDLTKMYRIMRPKLCIQTKSS